MIQITSFVQERLEINIGLLNQKGEVSETGTICEMMKQA